MRICRCLLALAATVLAQETSQEDTPTSVLLTRANRLLATGLGQQALDLFNVAVERDPSSYLTLFKRGTAYLALGQLKRGLEDFESVLKLNDYDQARLQVARIQLKLGQFDAATAATSQAKADTTDLGKEIAKAANDESKAKQFSEQQQWQNCIDSATSALNVATNSATLRELRGNCYLSAGNLEDAIGELTRTMSLLPNSQTLPVQLSILSYFYLSSSSAEALTSLKQCLHFDPDSKTCKTAFRLIKALEKDLAKARNFIEGGKWASAAGILDPRGSRADQSLILRVRQAITDYQEQVGGLDAGQARLLTTLLAYTCKAHVSTNSLRLAAATCNELFGRDPNNIDALVFKGEEAMKVEDWQDAVNKFKTAFESGGNSDREVLAKLQKAERLLKQSKQKDYYKVLGVSRDADKNTIKRAYRKAAIKAHPDKGGSEAAMAAVNEAWEVLGNEELRARFDNGDDPNDPQAQQQGGFNPFAHHGAGGFHQFFHQGGGFPGQGQKVHFTWG